MLDKIKSGKNKIAVIGLGYVGLPIALEFARKCKVVGFDINQKRVDMMKNSIDPSGELESEAFDGCDILFTAELNDLSDVTFFIVAVPTPINDQNLPELTPLIKASETVGKVLKKGDYVVYESTVYPGCTEEDCIPILEKESGLNFSNDDFKVGYSPERINPGDKEHTLTKITKVVSGNDAEALEVVAGVYEMVIEAGVFRAPSIKVAEAAKIIENTQRDVNIALMNELSMIFDKLNINTFEVLEAAGTKWNFLKFFPGLVGGHCIGVDPYYLTYKAKQLGHDPKVILSGRETNDGMGAYIAKRTVQRLAKHGKAINECKVLVMGITFKEDVEDIRNSKVVDVVNELISYGVKVEIIDPFANKEDVKHEYNLDLSDAPALGTYDATIVAVNHREYTQLDENHFIGLMNENPILIDVKGTYKGKINTINYWSL